jgi:hypothetical protein
LNLILIACLIASVAITVYSTSYLVTIAYMQSVYGQEFEKPLSTANKSIAEDQIIVCVNNADQIDNNGLICHLYQADKFDFYQDAFDGSLFSKNDSFNMEVMP